MSRAIGGRQGSRCQAGGGDKRRLLRSHVPATRPSFQRLVEAVGAPLHGLSAREEHRHRLRFMHANPHPQNGTTRRRDGSSGTYAGTDAGSDGVSCTPPRMPFLVGEVSRCPILAPTSVSGCNLLSTERLLCIYTETAPWIASCRPGPESGQAAAVSRAWRRRSSRRIACRSGSGTGEASSSFCV